MSTSLKNTKTEKNLLTAFAGESQAKNRYTFFAKVAKKEGYEQIAAYFMETAEQEEQHAKQFFSFLEGGMVEITAAYPAGVIGTTEENLLAAAEGEKEEWAELYPHFAKIADEEGFPKIAAKFRAIAKAEAMHEERYRKLLANIKENKVFEKAESVSWVCRKCGYVHVGNKALSKCPSCEHPLAYFELKKENY
ncbi:MAG TPA: ferritin family protein [Bacteroidales bacterium]|nr:ferritin family protein [Bacteroidales bacterium]HOR82030.1 ferritin family protein [Bacteroidales bacterium]HPJ91306.1 ferritin family protein [Bacteroidales bacterium]